MQNVEKVLWNIKRFFPNPLSNDFIFLQFLYLSEKLFKAVVWSFREYGKQLLSTNQRNGSFVTLTKANERRGSVTLSDGWQLPTTCHCTSTEKLNVSMSKDINCLCIGLIWSADCGITAKFLSVARHYMIFDNQNLCNRQVTRCSERFCTPLIFRPRSKSRQWSARDRFCNQSIRPGRQIDSLLEVRHFSMWVPYRILTSIVRVKNGNGMWRAVNSIQIISSLLVSRDVVVLITSDKSVIKN